MRWRLSDLVTPKAEPLPPGPRGRILFVGPFQGGVGGVERLTRCFADWVRDSGFTAFAGIHAPYIWMRTPEGLSSWDFFDRLLSEAHVVGTPGSGFGPSGEGYYRISAFNSRENVDEALRRIGEVFGR